jgi:metallo-beta-lactamase class B
MKFNPIIYYILFYFCFQSACLASKSLHLVYQSNNLRIEQISKNTYLHISYLDTESFGKVACNGMMVIDKGESIVFDTPSEDSVSRELIHWLTLVKKTEIKAVVVNHFHVDCLGGLGAFHAYNIPSYSNQLTIDLAKEDQVKVVPIRAIDTNQKLQIGNTEIKNHYFGEGHTKDNIVSYVPSEKVLFGGCLIKAIGAGKGNLADANIEEWAKTVTKIRAQYPLLKKVIPGHGMPGGIELLDYTVEMFMNE